MIRIVKFEFKLKDSAKNGFFNLLLFSASKKNYPQS